MAFTPGGRVTAERTRVEVSQDPLDLSLAVQQVSHSGAGAVATFSGVTRDNFQGKAVTKLVYEAYVPMALAKMQVRLLPLAFEPLRARLFDACASQT